MLYYIPLLFVPIYVYFAGKYFKHQNEKELLLFVPFLYLLLLAGFRNISMGTDYAEYVYWFELYTETGEMRYDIGWRTLNFIAKLISHNYYALGLTTSFVILTIVIFTIRKQVKPRYWYLSFVIYIFNPYLYIQSNFNIMRQGVAMTLVLLALYFLADDKYWRAIILIVAAATFHKSAIIMLVLPIIRKMKFNDKFLLTCGTVSFLLSLVLKDSSLIMVIGSFLGYDKYALQEDTMFNFSLYKIFIYVVIVVLCCLYDEIFDDDKKKFYGNVYILSLCALEIVLVNDVAYRMYLYFSTLHILLLPSIISYAEKKLSRDMFWIARTVPVAYYIVFFVAFWVTTILNNDVLYFPYLPY